jgi:hypothetical protein
MLLVDADGFYLTLMRSAVVSTWDPLIRPAPISVWDITDRETDN